ncbi:ABC transporter ATP-binding protein [Candidatus Calescamantes bacterium]|nr:ABC transporter ATP-binding protein [Candidatus Calescamantes bacterium]
MSEIVSLFGVTKIFKDFWGKPKVKAVDNLDLQINEGEIFGLLGPNGSGKTTTLKLILGLLYPTRGRISVFNRPPGDNLIKRLIGYLPEEDYLYPYLTAREIMDFYGRIFNLSTRVRKERADYLLQLLGIKGYENRPIGEYSKGMARRIGLAQALINDPQLLILDEPTSGMDPIGAREVKDLLLELKKKGKTILISSHLLADIEDICDRIGILYEGKLIATGEVKKLLSPFKGESNRLEKFFLQVVGKAKEEKGEREKKVAPKKKEKKEVKIIEEGPDMELLKKLTKK